MTEAQTALARRAVACKGWRWMAGMLVCAPGDRGHITAVFDGDEGVAVFVCFDEETRSCRFDEEIGLLLPDLSDPATLGCLLALVREARGEPRTVVVPLSGGRWGVAIPNVLRQSPTHKGDTEAEALVAALEAAPTSG